MELPQKLLSRLIRPSSPGSIFYYEPVIIQALRCMFKNNEPANSEMQSVSRILLRWLWRGLISSRERLSREVSSWLKEVDAPLPIKEIKHLLGKSRNSEIDELIKKLDSHDLIPRLWSFLETEVEAKYKQNKVSGKNNAAIIRRGRQLARIFHLSPIERNMVLLVAAMNITNEFRTIVREISENSDYCGNNDALAHFLPYTRSEVFRALDSSSSITRLELFTNHTYSVRDEIAEFLAGSRSQPLSDCYYHLSKKPELPLDRLMIERKDVEAIHAILLNRPADQGVNILLAGAPGTGKTETARSLAHELGLRLYELRTINENEQESSGHSSSEVSRIRALWACQRMTGSDPRGAILIDEADALLGNGGFQSPFFFGGSKVGKAMINEALDRAPGLQIWIANNLDGIDPSTRRRFAYAVRYDRMGLQGRLSIWETACRRHGLDKIVGSEDRRRLATSFQLDAGCIDSALRNSANLPTKGWNQSRTLDHIERLLSSQSLFSDRPENTSGNSLLSQETISPEFLNISPKQHLDRVLKIVGVGVAEASQPTKREQFRKAGLAILLQGPPGTGKTHLARYLAAATGRPLLIKTASQILNKYVGETEKTIREAFEKAERDGAILFFDEIDGLLCGRQMAKATWEITQVNELLSAMEAFKGIFLAATNHLDLVDTAACRRFQFTFAFGSLSPDSSTLFYERLLVPISGQPFTNTDRKRLQTFDGLVPSDFAIVRRQFLMSGEAGATHAELIESLIAARDDRSLPTRQIGFLENKAMAR
ncbi:MAG: ATP-binding protein [Candidatus Riflebacteria bacterium]|nr:ATP-binding protein [Candidatus Riflebacteria bacterium]